MGVLGASACYSKAAKLLHPPGVAKMERKRVGIFCLGVPLKLVPLRSGVPFNLMFLFLFFLF